MNIPLLDLQKQYSIIQKEIDTTVSKVLSSSQYIMGPEVKNFETEISQYLGCKYAISCANGTDALVLALTGLGIGQGDEVITSPFTFFATAEAISRVGATPVFVDVVKETYNINPFLIEDKITSKTKAILPVHIFGQPAQMDEIMSIAKRYNLLVIEDACQSIGAAYKGQMTGTIGDAGCFSFFPTKNLACFGDGGLITTNNENTYKVLKALRAHGGGTAGQEAYNIINNLKEELSEKETDNTVYNPAKYYNYLIGFNSRLDEVQAAILRIKLKYLDQWNGLRQEHAQAYNSGLKGTKIIMPKNIADINNVYHQYVVQSENRDSLITFLKEKGISTGVYYPVPLHLQKAYENLGYKLGDLPVSEYLSNRTFALPIYPELSTDEQDYIINCIKDFEKR